MYGCHSLVRFSQLTEVITRIKLVESMLQKAASTKAH